MRIALTVLVVLGLLPWSQSAAMENPADAVVVTVNGVPITLRELEDEILKKEGSEHLRDLVSHHLDQLDWATLADDEVIFAIAGQRYTRLAMAAGMLEKHGAEVRTAMINIKIVEQALAEAGMKISDDLLNAEFDRMEKAFVERLKREGHPRIPFENYLEVQEGVTKAEFMSERGFRMAAGLHELVHRLVELPLDTLQQHYAQYYDERFLRRAAARVQVVSLPFRNTVIGDVEVLDESQRQTVRQLMNQFVGQVNEAADAGEAMAAIWRIWGRAHDPQSRDGRMGWVTSNGSNGETGARTLPPEVAAAALAVPIAECPQLLQPIEHAEGMDLVYVQARREESRPTFDEIKAEVRRDYIETHLTQLTNRVMKDLQVASTVEYEGFAQLLQERRRQAVEAAMTPVQDEPAGAEEDSAAASAAE